MSYKKAIKFWKHQLGTIIDKGAKEKPKAEQYPGLQDCDKPKYIEKCPHCRLEHNPSIQECVACFVSI